MYKLSAVAILLNALALISPAAAETIKLQVESGVITGIKDRQSGRLEVYLIAQSTKDLWEFTGAPRRKEGRHSDRWRGEGLPCHS